MTDVERCPTCGGTRGFQYVIRVGMHGLWGAKAWPRGQDSKPQKVQCLDCARYVRRDQAEKPMTEYQRRKLGL